MSLCLISLAPSRNHPRHARILHFQETSPIIFENFVMQSTLFHGRGMRLHARIHTHTHTHTHTHSRARITGQLLIYSFATRMQSDVRRLINFP